MFVIIIGGGRTGSQLARMLIKQEHEVSVVEYRSDILPYLHKEIPTEIIYEGNPVVPEVLEHAGIRKANVLAAVTSKDDQNLAVCYLAKAMFNVPRTIARVNNPVHSWLFNNEFNIDVVVNPAELMASLISEEMSMGDMMTLLKLHRGNYSLVEEKIIEGAPSIGVAIKDLDLSDNCVIAAIIRDGNLIVPRGMTVLQSNDEVLAVTDPDGALQLADLLTPDDAVKNNHTNHVEV
jgi:trk system potassium uptake protein TrkA